MSDVKVFVSYSWSVEKLTGVVGEIQSLCPARGIEFVRDENAMQHGDVIMDFMNELTSGDHIITVFSKPYFKSQWCMYELLQISQKKSFKERTHPIIADDCDLGDAAYRMDSVEYWVEEHKKFKDLLQGRDPSLFVEEFYKLNMLRDISQNANALMNFAVGRLTKPLAELKAQGYSQILGTISPLLAPTENQENGTVEQDPVQSKLLSSFRKEITENIRQELSDDDISVFVNALREELNKIRLQNAFSDSDLQLGETSKIAEALVWVMENGGKDVPAIQSALKGAVMHCLNKKGKYRAEAQPFKEPIIEATEQLLGWLVLAAVDENHLSGLLPDVDFNKGIYFEIPVETQGGVELIVSRYSEHPADVGLGGSEVEATYQTCVSTQQFDWKETSSLDTLKLLIWKKVFPEVSQDLPLTPAQVGQLDAAIAIRRNDDWDREHHYLAIQGTEMSGNTHYKSVCDKLLTELPNLTLVNFGVPGQQSVFYMPEHHLMQGINHFLSSVNKV